MKYVVRLGDPELRFKGRRAGYVYAGSHGDAMLYAAKKYGVQVLDVIRIEDPSVSKLAARGAERTRQLQNRNPLSNTGLGGW